MYVFYFIFTQGVNSRITYSIVGGDGKFRVTSQGNIVVNENLDFEMKQQYQFQVKNPQFKSSGLYKQEPVLHKLSEM